MIPETALWPEPRRRELLELLVRRSGLSAPGAAGDSEALAAGVDLHSVHAYYDTLPTLVRGAAPAIITRFAPGGGVQFIGILRGPDPLGRVTLLDAGGAPVRVSATQLVAALRAGIEASQAPAVDA
ncbi:MAG: hypothetical protein H6739_00005, partial [Alphaproteobacteria bacterium]|nr:hypothetical protein [Alphaproteobacteria bacterium]